MHKNKKVLIIARDFPPYYPSLGGVMRVLKMAEFFQDNGIEVYILSAKGVFIDYFGYEKLVNQLNVTYLDDPLQRYYNQCSLANRTPSKEENVRKANAGKWLKKIINEFSIPDKGIFFVNRYVREAEKLIKEKRIENIIVSSPPHSTQIIGYKLKKTFKEKINLIVDYRDSWNATSLFQKNNSLAQALNILRERKALNTADHIVYISQPMVEKINMGIVDISKKSTLIMNGFDLAKKLIAPSLDLKHKSLSIGYFGSISDHPNSFRNPKAFFNAISNFGKDIAVHLIGEVTISAELRNVNNLKLQIDQSITHEEALSRMSEFDLLLVLHSDPKSSTEVLTGKLFEYMLAQRPILVVGPKDMEAGRFVKENHLGYHIDIINDDIAAELQKIHKLWEENKLLQYSIDNVAEFSRQNQYSKFLDIIR